MKINQWKVARMVVSQTEQAVLVGAHEVFVLWAAPINRTAQDAGVLEVDQCIVPAQKPGVSPQGVWVHIEGRELQRIQYDNHDAGKRSVIQLHTHPDHDVRMSPLDREWEVVRHVGALSIIVPHYGRHGLLLHSDANVYEREAHDWRLWSKSEAKERLVIA